MNTAKGRHTYGDYKALYSSTNIHGKLVLFEFFD